MVAPICAFEHLGGFKALFGDWGGESISWARETDDSVGQRCGDLVDRLHQVSDPVVVEVRVEAERLPGWKPLWPTFVATLLGHADRAHEWFVQDGAPVAVSRLITPGDIDWQDSWIAGSRHSAQ